MATATAAGPRPLGPRLPVRAQAALPKRTTVWIRRRVAARRVWLHRGRRSVASAASASDFDSFEMDDTPAPRVTLERFLIEQTQGMPEVRDSDLVILLSELGSATKLLADKLAGAGLEGLMGAAGGKNQSGDKQQKLDVTANEIFTDALAASGQVRSMASEEDDEAVVLNTAARYAVVFDPLDGSRNIDAAIPTGTIFGIYLCQSAVDESMDEQECWTHCAGPCQTVFSQENNLVTAPSSCVTFAAGYALYSSATMLVLSLGNGTHGFTLDRRSGEYVLSHPDIEIPARGQIYSVNDARYFDWPSGLQRYIDTIRKGEGQNPKQYSARYICSLVADFHRTLLYGGVAMNPRGHLRLVYEANPLAMLAEQAGGSGSDGVNRILSIQPKELHQRLPLFLGSPEDIEELCSYGDVQQGAKTYDV